MSKFNALVLNRDDDENLSHAVEQLDESELPAEGEVLIAVEYSTVNYKDGLCFAGQRGLVKSYPHIPGIDFAGEVISSEDDRYSAGDKVILTGWRVGEIWWGGFAQRAKVKADWLVPLPKGLTTRDAMSVGTAGLTAMLSILTLEDRGLQKGDGEILLTGAGGGVGSIATALLASMGHEVTAMTGRPDIATYLTGLGATNIIARSELEEETGRPLESARWAGSIDAVGGKILARILTQMKPNTTVAAVGNAGGNALPTTVIPFLLRGVGLIGIDSASCPYARRVQAWARIASDLPTDKLSEAITIVGLADVPGHCAGILEGRIQGRVLVDVNA